MNSVHPVRNTLSNPKLKQNLNIFGHTIEFEVDTVAGEYFLNIEYWRKLGSPGLKQCTNDFESAIQHKLLIKGSLHTVCK